MPVDISVLFFCCCCCLWISVAAKSPDNLRWGTLQPLLNSLTENAARQLLPFSRSTEQYYNISARCQSSLGEWGLGLQNQQNWALQMLDATGKIPTGFMEGSFMELGSYDECIRVDAKSEKTHFTGKHCSIKLALQWKVILSEEHESFRELGAQSADVPIEMLYDYRPMEVANIIYGLCLPSECNTRDVLQLTNSVLDKYSLPLDVVRVNCEKKSEGRELTSWEIAACCFLASVVILVLVGTFIDLCTSRDILNRSKTGRILRGFSFYTNAKEVAETTSRAGTFGCFHGMRVISLLWVMLSHSLFLAYPDQITVFKPLSGNLKISRSPIMALLDNASPSVDTFFVISGFLCAYSTWKSLEINGDRIDILSILLRKLWRLSPSMWATIALTLLLPRLGNGPLWKENSEYLAGACQRNGWTNLLFLQNLWSMEDMCLVHTWYVACLMQLFVIGVPLLQLCYRRFWLGLGVGIALASTGMAVCMLLTVLYGLPPAPLYSSYGVHAIVKHVSFQLIKPHQHVGAFLIGAATGYIYFKRGKTPVPKIYAVLGWIVSLAAMSGVVFGVQSFRTDKVYEGPVAVLYSGLFRNIWSTAVAWICFACVTGRGGLVNDLLSWSPFSSLARLSYAAYLLHPLLICYHTSRIRFPYYFDYITLGDRYVSYVVITFVFAYFFHLMIEMPFSNAERVLLDTKKKTESKES